MNAFLDALLPLLQCPYCKKPLEFIPKATPQLPNRSFGILHCACSRFPVVDGIPILQKNPVEVKSHVTGNTQISGPAPETLNELILNGQGSKALIELIAFPWCPSVFKRFRLLKRIIQHDPVRPLALALRKKILERSIAQPDETFSVEEWLDLFYRRSLIYGDLFNYFFFRFAQPRYLAALSLLKKLPCDSKPLLDLACGFGHLIHYLTEREHALPVIGLDRNFFQLWVAKHWMAPRSHFVCADADAPLPFQDDTLSGVFCSDAFHYFNDKTRSFDEMRRCSPRGTIILTRVGNSLVEPNEGKELSPEEYLRLANSPSCRLAGEIELLQSYLNGRDPDFSDDAGLQRLRTEKWLSLIVTKDSPESIQAPSVELPHAVGRLAVNPIYKIQQQNEGTYKLTFHFPSSWYAFENEAMETYHAREIIISRKTLHEITQNIRSREVNELISRYVVLGMPALYRKPEKHDM